MQELVCLPQLASSTDSCSCILDWVYWLAHFVCFSCLLCTEVCNLYFHTYSLDLFRCAGYAVISPAVAAMPSGEAVRQPEEQAASALQQVC